MVGVPRSRGCTSCKQQKKKCSGGTEPPCVRCKRLNIPCIGLGERFIKFQDEGAKFALANANTNTATLHGAKFPNAVAPKTKTRRDEDWEYILKSIPAVGDIFVPANLSSSLTALTSGLAYSISDPSAETNFGLIWSFGPFLCDVPKHLGRNRSLDAAIDGLVTAYNDFRVTQRFASSPRSLSKYSKALTSLRNCLTTTETACEPETLCAIMVIMILETLIGVQDTRGLMHCDGAARIFRCRGTRPPSSDLERMLLLTLRGPVVCQAYFVDESFFSDEQWASMTNGFLEAEKFQDPSFFPLFAATARLFQRTRSVLLQSFPSPAQIEELLTTARSIRKGIGERVSKQALLVASIKDAQLTDPHAPGILYKHSHYTREYGMLLITQMQINCILARLDEGSRAQVEAENVRLSQEICDFAEKEGPLHRPLGSLYIRLMLHYAYLGATSEEERGRARLLLFDYVRESSVEVWKTAMADMDKVSDYFKLRDLELPRLRLELNFAEQT